MKKLIAPLSLLLIVNLCFGQATTKITKDSLAFREKYEVLKSNPNIKQGKYTLLVISSGKILTTGSYKNNLKDGKWHEYNSQGYTAVEGTYKNGKKVGEWGYYGKMWELLNKYNFDTHTLIYHKGVKADSTTYYKVIRGKDTIDAIMDRPPIYLSGNEIMLRNLMYNVQYPPQALAAKAYGKVVIAFTIDEQGHTRDYKVVQKLGYGLDEEALKQVSSIPEDWVPGILDGKAVPVVVQLPVNFKVQ